MNEASAALVVRHWVVTDARTQVGLLVELFNGLAQTNKVVHVEIHIANPSRYNFLHLLRTVLHRPCEVSKTLLSRILSYCVSNPEVSKHEFIEALAEKYVLRLDILMHYL